MSGVRTRVAPSPTGFFHIGNAKAALLNWLVARKSGGTFILRLEDTDAERSRDEYADIIGEALSWLEIEWDEGPGFHGAPDTGAYGPYRQSQRTALYRREAERLLEAGRAYRCYCSKEELDAERGRAEAEKLPPRYNGKCRNLTASDVAAKGAAPYAVRFKVEPGITAIDDLIQGMVRVDNKEIDDFIIVRPNGDPVFHLAVVVDDGLMKVTHVLRGDDHLTNAARHVMLFEALGYPLPAFGHYPLVLDEHGRKYSKRLHGANLLDWRDDGFLPETLINYLALLGWTPGDDRELFTPRELIEAFSLERLSQSAARFDLKKVQWLNGQHMRMLSVESLRDRLLPILEKAGLDVRAKSAEWLTRMAAICQEKIRTLNEIVLYTDFFFVEPAAYEEKAVKKQWRAVGAAEDLKTMRAVLHDLDPFNADALRAAYEALAQRLGAQVGRLIHPTRLALTGKSVGPGLYELAELLGKDACIARMDRAIEYVTNLGEPTP